MIVGGFYLGIACDTFRRFSPFWSKRKFLRYFLEISFWMGQTLLLFYILYRVNAGELRFYVFIACMLGFSIYQVVFAELYRNLLEVIIRILLIIYCFCKKVIHIFIITPIRVIIYLISLVLQFTFLILSFMIKLMFMPIRWIIKVAFSLLPKNTQKNIRKMIETYSIIKSTSLKWVRNILFKRK